MATPVITKCHSLELHSWSVSAFAWIVTMPAPAVVDVPVVPVVPVDVEVPVPPEVDVDVDVEVPVPVVVDVPVPVVVPVLVPPVPQLIVKFMNLSPPAAGVLCRTCNVCIPFASVVIVAVVQLPVLFAVHEPLASIAPPDASLMSHVPVPFASQPEPWIWKVQIAAPLPVSFTIPAVALAQAHAGLAPAVARSSNARLVRIAT